MRNIKELEKIPQSEWAKIYCQLNCWQFPDNLLHIKPKWWDHTFDIKKRTSIIRPLLEKIKNTIGEKACSREWNINSMTDESHEIWWNSTEDEKIELIKNNQI